VAFEALTPDFDRLKKVRRIDPLKSLELVGRFASSALAVLAEAAQAQPLAWRGGGDKAYIVFTANGQQLPFSRAVNRDLFEPDPIQFEYLWREVVTGLLDGEAAGTMRAPLDAGMIERAVYTAVVGYGAAVDLFNPGNRGGPGSFLEMVTGPAIALLTRRRESGALRLPIPDSNGEFANISVDLTFVDPNHPIVLVVPTKISSRERISQAAVHQRILDAISPGSFRSILCLANENNVMPIGKLAKADRTANMCYARDTLVPGTIALYQRYVARLSGLYYLDPPYEYITGKYPNLPPVATYGRLLTDDLPRLLDIE
jgi:hypothetical protein